jgi:diaminohydroxyphosphoribosylaminopyrimidine deaminase/5-amino-6-(5-phosphoribosylamino)uracil reductase
MRRAIELASRGEGLVEPNPMVGCVIVAGDEVVGEGYHTAFGAAHAEVEALQAAGPRALGATMFVTLEPCCHHGKTPPCTDAIIAAGIAKVVVALGDPFADVNGGGLAKLAEAGIEVRSGLMENEAQKINAPYFKLVQAGMPWIIAKWAMTLDGKIATKAGDSRWISNEASRAIVHQIRGRVDAIVVGRATAETDDPLLTARPAGARTATRVVLDSQASLSTESQLVQTCHEAPVLVAAAADAPTKHVERLQLAGCEVVTFAGDQTARLGELLKELGSRKMTNLLVEGGAQVLGSFFAADCVDEVHVFIAPKILGGEGIAPIAAAGPELITEIMSMNATKITTLEGDVYVFGRRLKA